MSYNNIQLRDDIVKLGNTVLDNEDNWRMFNYLLDLYWYKYGVNLRLMNSTIQRTLQKYNEIHG